MKITLVAGARPNFIKIAPLVAQIKLKQAMGENIHFRLVHTGQHYDDAMSGQFFKELEIPAPDINLNCGGGSQAEQTAQIMVAFEKDLLQHPTDLVVVVGDVTSTMACTITAKKLQTQVAHVEAGIRSFDMRMPEEINRMVTDSIADIFFTTTPEAGELLMKQGKKAEQIHFVGNVMIDTLLKFQPQFTPPRLYQENKLKKGSYWMLTLHRPSNVDEAKELSQLLQFIGEQAGDAPVIFPLHPRTQKNLRVDKLPDNLLLTAPLGYLEFNYLIQNALGVLTDSGGITEEASILNIPCITLRENTERPETIALGTNVLAGRKPELIQNYMQQIQAGKWKSGQIPEKWDGRAAERIVDVLLQMDL